MYFWGKHASLPKGRLGDDDDLEEQHSIYDCYTNLSRKGSHIYFYDEINEVTARVFRKLYEDAKEYLTMKYADEALMTNKLPETVTIHINSPGGNVLESFALYDYLSTCPIPCVAVVEGIAASGATILLMGCMHRMMTENSMILIHELRSGWEFSKYSSIKDETENLDILMKRIKSIYAANTKIPAKELDEILRHDVFFDASTSLRLGLTDQTIHNNNLRDLITVATEEKAKTKKKPAKKTASKKKEEPAKEE